MDPVCVWVPPTCPTGYTLYPGEADGRSCYSVVSPAGPAAGAGASCRAGETLHTSRPALPPSLAAVDQLRPDPATGEVWLEGTSAGDGLWRSLANRSLDTNSQPTSMADLSSTRAWYSEPLDSLTQLVAPRQLSLSYQTDFV